MIKASPASMAMSSSVMPKRCTIMPKFLAQDKGLRAALMVSGHLMREVLLSPQSKNYLWLQLKNLQISNKK